jgi:excisionase family DNA binding protein
LTAGCVPLGTHCFATVSSDAGEAFYFLTQLPMGSLSNAPRSGNENASTENAETTALLTVADVARHLNVSRSKIYGLIANGSLPVHRLPAIRISQDDLSEFLDDRRSRRSQPEVTRPTTIRLKHLR